MIPKKASFFSEPLKGIRDIPNAIPILRVLLISLEVGVTGYFGAMLTLSPSSEKATAFTITIATVVVVVFLHISFLRGWYKLVAWTLPSLLIITTSLGLYIFHGMRNTTILAYSVVLFIAALALGNIGVYVFGGLISIALTGLFLVEYTRVQVQYPGIGSPIQVVDWMIAMACVGILMVLLRTANRQIEAGFQLASSRADDLNEINATLEQKVAERTEEIIRVNQRLQKELKEREAAEQALSASETQLSLVFNTTSDMHILLRIDPGERFIAQMANRAYFETLAMIYPGASAELIGRERKEYLKGFGVPPEALELEVPFYREVLRTKVPVHYENEFPTPAGVLLLAVTISPVINRNGECTHVLWTGRDVTEKKAAERSLAESEALLREAQQVAKLGNFVFDLRSQTVTWSDEVYRIFDIPVGEAVNLELYQSRLHPEDFQKVMGAVGKAVETRQPYVMEHDLLLPTNEVKHVFAVGRPSPDKSGKITHIFGIVQDITERKKAENALMRSESLLKTTNEIARVGGWELDLRANELYWSDTIREIHEVPLDYVPKLTEGINFYAPEHIPVIEEALNGAIAGSPFDVELQIVTAKKNRLWVRAIGRPLKESGKVTKIQGVFQDIHQRKLAEEALRQSETLYRALFEQSYNGVIIINMDGIVIAANQTAADMYECEISDLVGSKSTDDAREDEVQDSLERFKRTLQEGQLPPYERNVITKKGTPKSFEITTSAVYDIATGEPRLFHAVLRDITEHKQAEEKLQESRRQLQLALEAGNVGLWSWDLKSNEVYFSPEWKKQIGYGDDELKNDYHEWTIRIHPDDLEATQASLNAALAAPYPTHRSEFRLCHKDGQYRWILAQGSLQLDAQGNPARIYGTHVDITERKQAEQALVEREQRYRTLFDLSPTGIVLLDVEGNFIEMNNSYCESLGYSSEELVGRNVQMLMPPENLEELSLNLTELHSGKRLDHISEDIRKDGTRRMVELREALVPLSEGRRGILITANDITNRKKADEALRLSEERYRILAKNLPGSALILYDSDMRFILADGPELEATGFTREMLEGKILYEALPPDFAAMVEPNMKRALAGEIFKAVLPFGDNYYEYSYVPIKDRSGAIMMAMILANNITERKQAEDALRESYELLSLFIKNSPIYTYIKEVTPGESRVRWASENFAEMIGAPGLQMADKTMRELFPPEFAEKITADDWGVINDGHVLNLDEDLNGRNYTTIKYPIIVGGKNLLAGYTIDITERKQAEEKIKSSLREKETLLREIHHRVKNNLQVISSLLYLQAQSTTDATARGMLQESRDRVESISLVHEKLYQSADLAQIPFGTYINDLTDFLYQSYGVSPSKIKFNLQADYIVLNINKAVPCGLILSEIVSNVFKHAFPGERTGTLHISLEADPDHWVHLLVSDDGVGFPDGFTSRPSSSLGITLIDRLANQLQGKIERLSSAGGTEYHIRFQNID